MPDQNSEPTERTLDAVKRAFGKLIDTERHDIYRELLIAFLLFPELLSNFSETAFQLYIKCEKFILESPESTNCSLLTNVYILRTYLNVCQIKEKSVSL